MVFLELVFVEVSKRKVIISFPLLQIEGKNQYAVWIGRLGPEGRGKIVGLLNNSSE